MDHRMISALEEHRYGSYRRSAPARRRRHRGVSASRLVRWLTGIAIRPMAPSRMDEASG